jgi:hypothetical protein
MEQAGCCAGAEGGAECGAAAAGASGVGQAGRAGSIFVVKEKKETSTAAHFHLGR